MTIANIFNFGTTANPVAVHQLWFVPSARYITTRDNFYYVNDKDFFIYADKDTYQSIVLPTTYTAGRLIVVMDKFNQEFRVYRSSDIAWDLIFKSNKIPDCSNPKINNNSFFNFLTNTSILPLNNIENRQVNVNMSALSDDHIFIIADTANNAYYKPILVQFVNKLCNGRRFISINKNGGFIVVRYIPLTGYYIIGYDGIDVEGINLVNFEFSDLTSNELNDSFTSGLGDLSDSLQGGNLSSLAG